MNKQTWVVLSSLLWATQLQAQAAPAHEAKPASGSPTGSNAASKPTNAAAPAGTQSAGAAKPAAPSGTATATPGADKSSEWTLDPAHSHVGFTSRHLGFSKVKGEFKKFQGVVKADPKTGKIATLEATAETASIDTGIEKRDAHLRQDDFFNSEKFPQLKLVAHNLKWNGNKFTANADVTIRDVTKSVPFKGELLGIHNVNFGQGEQVRAGYEATATISRKEFGLKWNTITEGIAVVGDAVDIDLAAEIFRVPATSASATPSATAPGSAVASAAAAPAKPAAAPTTKPTPTK